MTAQDKPSMRRILYVYRDSPAFRTVHASGAYGGITPSGDIFAAIYSERTEVPLSSYIDIDSTGKPGEEVANVSKAVVREVEVGVLLDLQTAKAFQVWLNNNIATLEAAMKSAVSEHDDQH